MLLILLSVQPSTTEQSALGVSLIKKKSFVIKLSEVFLKIRYKKCDTLCDEKLSRHSMCFYFF